MYLFTIWQYSLLASLRSGGGSSTSFSIQPIVGAEDENGIAGSRGGSCRTKEVFRPSRRFASDCPRRRGPGVVQRLGSCSPTDFPRCDTGRLAQRILRILHL